MCGHTSKGLLCFFPKPNFRVPGIAFFILALAGSLVALGPQKVCAANVNPGTGYTNDFSTQPLAADWTTRSFGTGSGLNSANEITNVSGMDAAIQTNSANLFTLQCTSASGNPPEASANAVWSTNGYVQTRCYSVAGTLLMGRFVNNTGTNAAVVHINYDYTTNRASAVTEEVPGLLVYYSLSGAANSWSNIPALSQAPQGSLSVDLALSGVWTNGGTLYLLWADDNSTATDTPLDIDNFYISVIGPATPLCVLTSPTNSQSFGAIATVTLSAIAGPGETGSITGLGFYDVTSGFLGNALNPPYTIITNLGVGDYKIYAVATNSEGALLLSATNTISVTNVPFTAALVSPTNGMAAGAPAAVTLQATVIPGSGASNAGVAFYEVTSGYMGRVLSPPYMLNTNLGVGIYQFYTLATNSLGAMCFSSTNTFTVTNIPLSVTLLTPTNGATYGSSSSINFSVTNIPGSGATVTGVAYYDVATGMLGNALPSAFSRMFTLKAGTYQLYAITTNSFGQIAFSRTNTVVVTNVVLSVKLMNPMNGTYYSAPASVPLWATVVAGTGATTKGVGFYDVTTGFLASATAAPYSTNVALGAGIYGIYAVATNSLGQIAFSSTNTVNVTNVAMFVNLVSPTNGSVFAFPATVTLSARITPGTAGGGVGVGFYDVTNGFLASATEAPFSNSVPLNPGIYLVYAIATNGINEIAFSTTNTITVSEVPLTIELNSPANNGVYSWDSIITCQATPTLSSSGSPVESVSFYSLRNGDVNLLFTDTTAPYSNQVSGLTEGTYGIFAVVLSSEFQIAVSKVSTITIVSGILRGPYMGSRGETNINIRWRTSEPNVGRVRYGPSASSLTESVDETTSGTNHSVTLTGLLPETKYYYSIGTPARTTLASSNYYFKTAPPIGSPRSTRIFVLSDFGEQTNEMESIVRDVYLNYVTTNERPTDVWLTGGDNEQTAEGQDSLFQTGMFAVYSNVLQNTPINPGTGNHDSFGDCAFWSIFDLPYHGQTGGYPSDSPHYYSFDYANIHFISLDSFHAKNDPSSPLYSWLTNDLNRTTQKWIVANFHAPVYSKVHYDSDTMAESLAMRTNIVPVLEAYGVDIVINGHTHALQRTPLIQGHYDVSSTFSDTNKVDGGDGRFDGSGPYIKTNKVGTVYMVAPTGCSVLRGSTNTHPACIVTVNDTAGFLIFDVNTNRLDFRMITSAGEVADYFTMLKPGGRPAFAAIPRITNGIITLVIQGTPGEIYTVQFTDSLLNPWEDRINVTIPPEGTMRLQDDAGRTGNRFYRLIYPAR